MKITKAYVAGFFDGEGSIGIYVRKNSQGAGIRTQLTQNKNKESLYILNYLKNKYGGNISEQRTLSDNIKYNWQLNVNGIKPFIKDIIPYLIMKKSQAQLALYWLENKPKIKRDISGRIMPFTNNEIKFTNKIINKMKALKS